MPLHYWSSTMCSSSTTTMAPAASSPSKHTSFSCHCGDIRLTFQAPKPGFVAECCCCDCRHARQYCWQKQQQQQQPPTTNNTGSHNNHDERPVLLYYVDNDIIGVEHKGQNVTQSHDQDANSLFYTLKLRSDSGSLRVVTSCCHSAVMALHPLYLRNRVAVMMETCNISSLAYQDSERHPLQPMARMQTKFCPPTQEQLADTKPTSTNTTMKITSSDDPFWVFSIGLMQYMMWPFRLGPNKGLSARQLIQRFANNKPNSAIILNIPEDDLPGHFRTGGGMFSLTLKAPSTESLLWIYGVTGALVASMTATFFLNKAAPSRH